MSRKIDETKTEIGIFQHQLKETDLKFYETQPANPVDSEDTAESFGRQTDWQYPRQCWIVLVRFGGHTSEPCTTTFQLLTTDMTSQKFSRPTRPKFSASAS